MPSPPDPSTAARKSSHARSSKSPRPPPAQPRRRRRPRAARPVLLRRRAAGGQHLRRPLGEVLAQRPAADARQDERRAAHARRRPGQELHRQPARRRHREAALQRADGQREHRERGARRGLLRAHPRGQGAQPCERLPQPAQPGRQRRARHRLDHRHRLPQGPGEDAAQVLDRPLEQPRVQGQDRPLPDRQHGRDAVPPDDRQDLRRLAGRDRPRLRRDQEAAALYAGRLERHARPCSRAAT